jgi:hypothetical protein
MRIYVTGYQMKAEFLAQRQRGETIPRHDIYDISYHAEPHWQFLFRTRAEMELVLLESMQPHIGDHYCRLEIEHLGKEEYAIVCNDHPENLA